MARKRLYLRRIASEVQDACILLGTPTFVRKPATKGRKAVGVRYENRVQDALQRRHKNYIRSPWLQYGLSSQPGRTYYAQPDGLLVDLASGVITIVEIKYTHTPDAYFQLIDQYSPIVTDFFGKELWKFATIEVCRWYDAAIVFPTECKIRDSIASCRPGEFAVSIMRTEDL